MNINDVILKHYLRSVYFLTGTAYAGKSTMAAMLADKYGMIHCGENYHHEVASLLATPDQYPNLCYFKTMKDWQEFVNRDPEVYERWIYDTSGEITEFEVAALMALSATGTRRIIVDTNIPLDVLKRIAGYHQVAVMLSPQSVSVDRFFDRSDPDKQFILSKIMEAPDPEKTMRNYREGLARINSQEHYDEYANSGFFTMTRNNPDVDTREETMQALACHFRLDDHNA